MQIIADSKHTDRDNKSGFNEAKQLQEQIRHKKHDAEWFLANMIRRLLILDLLGFKLLAS